MPTIILSKYEIFLQVAALTWINPSVRVTLGGAEAWVPAMAIRKTAFDNLAVSWSVRIFMIFIPYIANTSHWSYSVCIGLYAEPEY